MKKAIIVLIALAAVSCLAFAQAAPAASGGATPAASPATATPAATTTPTDVAAPDPNKIGVDTAQQELKEISVDQFESAGFWDPEMSNDEGVITARLFEGHADTEPIADPRYDLPVGDPKSANKYVLGVRADFFRRGDNELYVLAKKPIPVEGIAKTISVWVVGRNYNHELKVIVQDFFGGRFELPMGKLNFQGWKKLSVAVPPQNPDGRTGIVQRNFHFNTRQGLKIVGFKIVCDPDEAFGTYYVYFDDLRAVTDLFAEEPAYRDPNDMADNW